MSRDMPTHLQLNVPFASMNTIAAVLAAEGLINESEVEMDARSNDIWAVGSLFVYILTQSMKWFATAEGDMQTYELRKDWVSGSSAVHMPTGLDLKNRDQSRAPCFHTLPFDRAGFQF